MIPTSPCIRRLYYAGPRSGQQDAEIGFRWFSEIRGGTTRCGKNSASRSCATRSAIARARGTKWEMAVLQNAGARERLSGALCMNASAPTTCWFPASNSVSAGGFSAGVLEREVGGRRGLPPAGGAFIPGLWRQDLVPGRPCVPWFSGWGHVTKWSGPGSRSQA